MTDASGRVAESSTAVSQIAQDIASVHMSAQEMNASTEQVHGSADTLSRLAAHMHDTIARFRLKAA